MTYIDDVLTNNTRHQLGAYVTFATGKKCKSSVVFNHFSGQQFAGYLRLLDASSELWYCTCPPLRRQQSFYSTGFSCFKKFKFQYNRLLYCRSCAFSSKAQSTLAISDTNESFLFVFFTTPTVLKQACGQAIIPSQVQRLLGNN